MARQKDKEETILGAAFEVFRENGFTNASMKDIAAKAGLGKGTLYEYFQNKEDLFIHVVKENASYFFAEVIRRMSGKITLRAKINEIVKITQETSEAVDFFFKFVMFGDFFELTFETKQMFQEIMMSYREKYVDILRDLFEKGARDGVLRKIDVEFAANFTTDMIAAFCCHKGHALDAYSIRQEKDSDREKIIDFILHGIGDK
ncbi:transcriptional regulator [Desulfosporosinus acidiphilus SJ4]|uniref:Transcriptional regulator n=1 Tax=Desulfosporosinus acidiphilus (strain DSM 22704 / JCM 16185 / SJ4) TaxID=646529 RepID=I4D257_DESAJ|nr:TetR/AcrR family transcriptional regulator [Desulfosporosinus acidiphilus]AFM39881.1 transcriptional regulator [Desulfosporosinus acidiphilus SJ4]